LKEFSKIIDKVLMDKKPKKDLIPIVVTNAKSQAIPRLKIPKPKKQNVEPLPVVVPGPF